jgi:glycerate dehydrogenase
LSTTISETQLKIFGLHMNGGHKKILIIPPDFRAGLDVFEDEPNMKPGLVELDSVLIVPHIASATRWTREGMASLAAGNVAGILSGYPAWHRPDILSFLEGESPKAAPSIVNADELGIALYTD